jgi:CRP-like cAMP-binding protein
MNIRSWLSLLRHVTIKSFDKGEIIIQKGATKKEIFFIRKGLIRTYFTNEKLEEITFNLFPEHHFFTNVHAVLLDEPSHFTYQALERTKVYSIDYDAYFRVVANNPNLLDLKKKYLGKRVLKQAFQRIESLVLLSPEERYKKYMQDYPNVIGRTPDKYIANVLGITPVSLSRIRNRIASKKE